ncbi:TPA: restriction endonuclease subunit S [Legionella pneumophila]
MKFEWDLITLSELSLRTQYGYTASAEFTSKNGNPKFLRITDIQRGTVDWSTVPFCEIENNKLPLYKLEDGDIVVARTGNSTGENYCFESSENVIFASYLIRYKINKDKALPKFIWYQMRSKNWWDFVNNIKSGSAQAGANAKAIGTFQCTIPPLSTQKKIIHVLSTLDNKIELNKKINQTLESIAQAMFKSWFVDFDPVHAKANAQTEDEYDAIAKELGISREILNLFPSEFEESELGLIPKGWGVEKLGACQLEIESGRRPKGGIDKTLKFGVPSIGAESIQSPIGTFDYSNVKYVSQEFSNATRRGWAKNFDVMLYKDGGKPGLFKPRVSLYGEGFPFQEFMINEHVFILRSKMLGQFYLYYLIASDFILEQLIAKGSSKAAQPGLNQDEVKGSCFVLPPAELLGAYNKVIANMTRLQLNQGKQNKWLSIIRDMLTPKLLSGEIDVSNLNLEPEND